jgi:hypothetical protein
VPAGVARSCSEMIWRRSILLLVYGVGARSDVTEGVWKAVEKCMARTSRAEVEVCELSGSGLVVAIPAPSAISLPGTSIGQWRRVLDLVKCVAGRVIFEERLVLFEPDDLAPL